MIWLLSCVVEHTTITPPADTIVETVRVEDTAPPPCEELGSLSVDTEPIAWSWWSGEEPPSEQRALEVLAEPCEGFTAVSSASWLAAAGEEEGLVLAADPLAVPSGRHAASVSLHDLDSAEVLARIEVELEVWREPDEPTSKGVLIVAADGFDAEALGAAEVPTLERLGALGALVDASTQTADLTSCGPGWAAVLTGAEDHGVWTDGVALDAAPLLELPVRTWVGAEWEGFSDLAEVDGPSEDAAGVLRSGLETLHFVQLHDLDTLGHAGGFSSGDADYVAGIEALDAQLAVLVDSLLDRPEIAEESWLVVLTSDHGGDSWGTHGTMSADHQTVPLLLASPALRTASVEGASHLDVLPTVRAFLGLDPTGLPGTDWWGFESLCDDGLDDDGDGLVDCDDSDCEPTLACNTCPDGDLELGTVELEPWHDWVEPSCASVAEESLLAFEAPAEGAYVFLADTVGVLDGDCLGEELACDADAVSATLSEGQTVTVYAEGASLRTLGPPSCPDVDLGSGDVTRSWDRSDGDEGMLGDCGPLYAAETLSWTAPEEGYWVYYTFGSEGDTVLYALDGCGGEVTFCGNDEWGDDAWGYEYLYAGDERSFVVGSADGSEGRIDLVIYLY